MPSRHSLEISRDVVKDQIANITARIDGLDEERTMLQQVLADLEEDLAELDQELTSDGI